MPLPQGLYSSEFYRLATGAVAMKGYSSLEAWIREAPNYWYDEEKWKEVYSLASNENPAGTFEQKIGNAVVPIMATYLADDAETPVVANKGFEKMIGDIPRMGQGHFFSTKSYEDALKFEREVGPLSDRVYNSLMVDFDTIIKAVHSQRTFTGFQIESLGYYTSSKLNNNGGITNLKIDMHPVAENRKKCGGFGFGSHNLGVKKAWSDEGASPLGDLEDMYYYAWNKRILSATPSQNVFRMSRSAYEVLVNHKDTKTRVAMHKSGYMVDEANVKYYTVGQDDLNSYLDARKLPHVEIVEYYGFVQALDKDNMAIEDVPVSAFDENTVVLRPAGKFGELQWKRITNIFSTAMTPIYYTEGGAIAIMQDLDKKGEKFSAESICIPVPYAIQRTLYLSVNEAAS